MPGTTETATIAKIQNIANGDDWRSTRIVRMTTKSENCTSFLRFKHDLELAIRNQAPPYFARGCPRYSDFTNAVTFTLVNMPQASSILEHIPDKRWPGSRGLAQPSRTAVVAAKPARVPRAICLGTSSFREVTERSDRKNREPTNINAQSSANASQFAANNADVPPKQDLP